MPERREEDLRIRACFGKVVHNRVVGASLLIYGLYLPDDLLEMIAFFGPRGSEDRYALELWVVVDGLGNDDRLSNGVTCRISTSWPYNDIASETRPPYQTSKDDYRRSWYGSFHVCQCPSGYHITSSTLTKSPLNDVRGASA